MPDGDRPMLVGVARTPIGRHDGALCSYDGPALGAAAIDETVTRARLDPAAVDTVYLGVGMIASGVLTPARCAVLQSRLPVHVPSLTVDRACCSGMTAVALAAKDIRLGEAACAVAGGFESLSRTPYLLERTRKRGRGAPELSDPLTLQAPWLGASIASYSSDEALAAGIDRAQQDYWAVGSHGRFVAAEDRGFFAFERFALNGVVSDEGPRRDTSVERLAALATVGGSATITAGNAPGLSDGAAAVALAAEGFLRAHGLTVLGEVIAHVQIAAERTHGARAPGLCIDRLLERSNLRLDDIACIEINEAFALTPLVSAGHLARNHGVALGPLLERVNANGGAVAIGHPLGASGARLVMTLVSRLRARGGGWGIAAICGGYGQGDGILIRVN